MKRKPIHTTKAGTVKEILKALGITKKQYLETVKEIKALAKRGLI